MGRFWLSTKHFTLLSSSNVEIYFVYWVASRATSQWHSVWQIPSSAIENNSFWEFIRVTNLARGWTADMIPRDGNVSAFSCHSDHAFSRSFKLSWMSMHTVQCCRRWQNLFKIISPIFSVREDSEKERRVDFEKGSEIYFPLSSQWEVRGSWHNTSLKRRRFEVF